MKKLIRILLADDDRDDRELFVSLLKEVSPGADIIAVIDGTEVLSWLDETPVELLPDALVMDYSMPKITGAQVLHHICAQPRYHGMAKFILSTSAQSGYIDGCLAKGAIEYFVKPNSVTALRAIAVRIMQYIQTISKTPLS